MMQNLRLYLPILIGLAIFIMVALILLLRKKGHAKSPLVGKREQATLEEFHCLKSSMKQVNENIYIGQFVFTNRMDVTLNAPSKVPRQISED